MTDIDRLHKVVESKLAGRGSGKTFAQCHEVAGCIEVSEDKYIICIINSYKDFAFLFLMLREVLIEHGIQWDRIRYDIIANRKIIRFVPLSELDKGVLGLESYTVIDFTGKIIRG